MPEFQIFVNNQPFSTNEHTLTGSQIKALARIPDDYELFVEIGKESKPIGPEEAVKIHEKQHFRAIPPGTFGVCIASSKT